jgi:bacterial/archaeal transporter family protein
MDPKHTGLLFAALAAVAAAFTGIFAKLGMEGIPPILSTAIRSIVMMAFCLAVAAAAGMGGRLQTLHGKAMLMIVLSGIAGATSWLFGFLAYDKIGVSKTLPIDKLSVPLAVLLAVVFLGERPTKINWLGIAFIVAGAYLASRE